MGIGVWLLICNLEKWVKMDQESFHTLLYPIKVSTARLNQVSIMKNLTFTIDETMKFIENQLLPEIKECLDLKPKEIQKNKRQHSYFLPEFGKNSNIFGYV